MKVLLKALVLARLPIFSFAQGKPSGDPERIENGKPDNHQYEGEIAAALQEATLATPPR